MIFSFFFIFFLFFFPFSILLHSSHLRTALLPNLCNLLSFGSDHLQFHQVDKASVIGSRALPVACLGSSMCSSTGLRVRTSAASNPSYIAIHRISQLEDCTYSNLNLQMPLQRLPDVPSDPLSQYKHFCTGQHVISLSCSILLASNAEPVWVPHSSSCCCRSCSSWHGLISKARCGPKNHSFLSLFLCLSASVCLCV